MDIIYQAGLDYVDSHEMKDFDSIIVNANELAAMYGMNIWISTVEDERVCTLGYFEYGSNPCIFVSE